MPPRKSAFMDDTKDSIAEVEKELTPHEKRIEAVDGGFQIAQLGCLMLGQLSDAGAIGIHGHGIAIEVVKWAEENDKVLEKLDLFVKAGPIAGVIGAVIPLVAQFLVNHKVIKPEMLANAGVVAPESLESLMKTQLIRQAAQAMRVQMEAEEELEKLKAEIIIRQNGSDPDMAENAT